MFDIIRRLKDRLKSRKVNPSLIEIDPTKPCCSVCGGQPADRRIRGRRDVRLCKPCKKDYHRELKRELHGI